MVGAKTASWTAHIFPMTYDIPLHRTLGAPSWEPSARHEENDGDKTAWLDILFFFLAAELGGLGPCLGLRWRCRTVSPKNQSGNYRAEYYLRRLDRHGASFCGWGLVPFHVWYVAARASECGLGFRGRGGSGGGGVGAMHWHLWWTEVSSPAGLHGVLVTYQGIEQTMPFRASVVI